MKTDNYADIFTNTQAKTAPQALFATIEAAKRGQVGNKELANAASEFESVFLAQMLQAMYPDSSEPNPLFGNNEGDEIFQNMMMDEYAKQISKSGGIGIASYIERELLGQQEVSRDIHNQKYKLSMLKMDEDISEKPESGPTNSPEPVATQVSAPISDTDALLSDIFEGGV